MTKVNINKLLAIEQMNDLKWLYEFVVQEQKEGLIIKDLNARYEGKRGWNWIKVKNFKEDTIIIDNFTINNAGIRATDSKGNAVQIAGRHSKAVKEKIALNGSCEIIVQYLEKTKDGKMRFISFRGLKKQEDFNKLNDEMIKLEKRGVKNDKSKYK